MEFVSESYGGTSSSKGKKSLIQSSSAMVETLPDTEEKVVSLNRRSEVRYHHNDFDLRIPIHSTFADEIPINSVADERKNLEDL